MERIERFALFVQRLKEAAPAATFEEARLLLETILNRVEDQHSGVRFHPPSWRTDGRLYPPQDDYELETDIPDVRVFKTVRHFVTIGDNGAIRIEAIRPTPDNPETVVLDKPGLDGNFCSRG